LLVLVLLVQGVDPRVWVAADQRDKTDWELMVLVALKAQVAQLKEQRRELLVQPCKEARAKVAHLGVLSMVAALMAAEIMQLLLLEAEAQDTMAVEVQETAVDQTMAVLVAVAQVILAQQHPPQIQWEIMVLLELVVRQ
jgi:hypothetical protein